MTAQNDGGGPQLVMKGRAIIVHNIDHARIALTVAGEIKVAVTLLSAPGAAGYMGATVFHEMIKQAAMECPGVDFTAVLDCGDDPGLALGTMRKGIKTLSISTGNDTKARLKEIAKHYDAVIEDSRKDAIDLLYHADPARACRSWLGKEPI